MFYSSSGYYCLPVCKYKNCIKRGIKEIDGLPYCDDHLPVCKHEDCTKSGVKNVNGIAYCKDHYHLQY